MNTNPIKVILVDDHQDSLEMMRSFLSGLPDFQLIGLCNNGEELVEEVILKKPDLVIAEINLPKKNGMQAIKECRVYNPYFKFIFVTQDEEFAVEAFEIAATDYIVKPYEKIRLFEALEKAKNIIRFEQGKMEPQIEDLNLPVLAIRGSQCTRFIPLEDIYFIEKAGKKCLVYTETDVYETNDAIGKVLSRLNDSFFQGHRSFIINLQKISQITQQNETYIAYFNGLDKQAGISKLKISEVRERISH